MLDSGTIKIVVDAAHQLMPVLGNFASQDPAQRTPEDDALLRQLRVTISALNMALMEVPRMPPKLPEIPRPAEAAPTAPPPYTA